MKQFSNLMQRFLLLMLALSASISIDAHDFEAANEDGVVIYYHYIGNMSCAVTFRGSSYTNYNGEYSGAIKIPETVTYSSFSYKVACIDYSAFRNCSFLTSITIPSSVTSISGYAFSDCQGLTSIVVESGNPVYDSRNNCNAIIETASNTLIAGCKSTKISSSVTTIGESAFYGCNSLTSITIPNSVTTIGQGAFCGCTGLTSITIPNSVTYISGYTFYGCTGLTSITIPNSVTSIGNSAFYGCSGLTSVTIPNSVTTIGDSEFYGCTGLSSITIPSSVTSIGNSAFFNCSNLREIIFNSSPQIGSGAFSNDDRISYIYINATTAPYLENKTFTNEVYQYAYLHIPMGCYEEFSSAYGWRNFNRIKEDLDVNGTTYYTSLRIKQSDLGYVDQYVKVDEEYTVYIAPEGNRRINTVLFNGEDVTDKLVDGYYTTPTIKGRSVLSVSYEEISNDVKEIPVSSLKVYGYNGVLYIKDADDNAPLNVYDMDGKLVYNATIANGEATINLPSSEIYAVKVGERTIKVAL